MAEAEEGEDLVMLGKYPEFVEWLTITDPLEYEAKPVTCHVSPTCMCPCCMHAPRVWL